MGDAGGSVQLTELCVSLGQFAIDRRSQAEGRVNLQEENAHQRRAANTTREGKYASGGHQTRSRSTLFTRLLPPSETRCLGK